MSTEYDFWKVFPRMPKRVTIGDITVRDGFQHLETFISTRAKKYYLEQLIFAGYSLALGTQFVFLCEVRPGSAWKATVRMHCGGTDGASTMV